MQTSGFFPFPFYKYNLKVSKLILKRMNALKKHANQSKRTDKKKRRELLTFLPPPSEEEMEEDRDRLDLCSECLVRRRVKIRNGG